jgi:hypothetical protein
MSLTTQRVKTTGSGVANTSTGNASGAPTATILQFPRSSGRHLHWAAHRLGLLFWDRFRTDDWFDGQVLPGMPVLMVDHVAASAPFLLNAAARVQHKLKASLHYNYFTVVNKVGRGFNKANQHTEKLPLKRTQNPALKIPRFVGISTTVFRGVFPYTPISRLAAATPIAALLA